jgi:hypothetical protein
VHASPCQIACVPGAVPSVRQIANVSVATLSLVKNASPLMTTIGKRALRTPPGHSRSATGTVPASVPSLDQSHALVVSLPVVNRSLSSSAVSCRGDRNNPPARLTRTVPSAVPSDAHKPNPCRPSDAMK